MKIEKVLELADELYPNHYSRKMKLEWCYQVTADLAENVRRIYDVEDYTPKQDGMYLLPEGVLWEDVKALWVDGEQYTKTDARSFAISGRDGQFYINGKPKRIRVVYRLRLLPYEDQIYEGDFMFGANFINIPGHKLMVGDQIKVTIDGDSKLADVLEIDGDTVKVANGILSVNPGLTPAKIELVLQDETLCPPPFDEMYLQYVLSQIAYYQNDFELYNKYAETYNMHYNNYVRWYKETNPVDVNLKFFVRW